MQTSVKVNCGKPVLKLKFRTLRGLAILSSLVCGCVFLYSFNLLIVSMQVRSSLGVYIDLTSRNGKAFPSFILLSAFTVVFVDIFVLYYISRAFKKSKDKYLNSMLFVFVIICLVTIFIIFIMCILILNHAYSARQESHDGIIDAMKNYSKDSLTKELVDRMQVEYECCGSKNYSDWYNIKWYDANLINTATYPLLKGETPFSCCATQSVYPCIHHGIERASSSYIYKKDTNISVSIQGCHKMIMQKKQSTGWSLVLRLLILAFMQGFILVGLRFVQTGHLERKSFDREERLYTCWLIGCYGGKTKTVIPPPVPPLPPELLE